MAQPQEPATRKTVYILATLDTKGAEAAFLRQTLHRLDVDARLVDTGSKNAATVEADVARETLWSALPADARTAVPLEDRGAAVGRSAQAAATWIRRRFESGELGGVLAIGGSAGTTIGTAAMRALPLGIPKLMVSTLASGQVRHYVGDKDILMLNSVVDLCGLNRITRRVLAEAACAMAGMVTLGERATPAEVSLEQDRPLIAATMFGVTTACVEEARRVLDAAGYEVLVFHATGNGGQAMESLIDEGLIAGVLDITTTELADELVGGVLSAGPQRLTAAARRGIPQVVSLGATDMVNFHALETVPAEFARRKLYRHNANVTLMRTTAEECAAIGADIGRKLSTASGPVLVLAPMRGVSAIDREGQPFDDPLARSALVDGLRRAGPRVDVHEIDAHINDLEFARLAARRLLEMLAGRTA